MQRSWIAALALGAAGAGALVYTATRPQTPALTPSPRGGATGTGDTLRRNPNPGALPDIAIRDQANGSPVGAVATAAGITGQTEADDGTSLPSADPQVEALQRKMAEMESRLAAVQGAAAAKQIVMPAPGGAPGTIVIGGPLPPSKPPPRILPGTENRPGGPILYAPGPPWPYNEGLRVPDPPAVPGAGCLTCEAVPENAKAGTQTGTGSP